VEASGGRCGAGHEGGEAARAVRAADTGSDCLPDSLIDGDCVIQEEIAQTFGRLALGFFSRRGELMEAKANAQDIASRADRDVEAPIRARVAGRLPDDGFFGEELGATPGASGYTWVIAPIDGTSPFLLGLPHWCVSIAVRAGGTTVAGAIAAPLATRSSPPGAAAARSSTAWRCTSLRT
jgi:3'-phosphoadenosine 5'-phosphosulfate (PAPS) 3'-phosphatase